MNIQTICILAGITLTGVVIIVYLFDRAFRYALFTYMDKKLGPLIRTREEEVKAALEEQKTLFDRRHKTDLRIQLQFRHATRAASYPRLTMGTMHLMMLTEHLEWMNAGAKGFPHMGRETILEGMGPLADTQLPSQLLVTIYKDYTKTTFEKFSPAKVPDFLSEDSEILAIYELLLD